MSETKYPVKLLIEKITESNKETQISKTSKTLAKFIESRKIRPLYKYVRQTVLNTTLH